MDTFYEELQQPIPSYDGYFATSRGEIVGKKGNYLSKSLCDKGYLKVNISNKTIRVHRLIAEAFILNPDNKPAVNHKDGIKTNNNVENLEWVTHKENILHRKEVLGINAKPYQKSKATHHSKGKVGSLSSRGISIIAYLPNGEVHSFGSSQQAGISLFLDDSTGKHIRQAIKRNKNKAYKGIIFKEQ